MNVLFLTEGTQVPASRYRAQLLLPHFRRMGIQCTVRTGYGDAYNRLHDTAAGPAYKLACRLKRAAWTLTGVAYDAVFLQRTAIPHTAAPERMLSALRNRLVFDFDDAIYLGPGGTPSKLRKRAFDDAVRASAWVVAGNHHLADVAASVGAGARTSIIPTTLDIDQYVPRPDAARAHEGLVVGWMGTSGNFAFLRSVLPSVLAAVESVEGTQIRIVSNATLDEYADHPRVEQIPWSATDEISLLQSFDVGLMPLADTPLTRGKCGFKMLQYMSVGCPVLASDVGANRDLFSGSEAGHLLPADDHDWSQAVRQTLLDSEFREHAGHRGRAHVVANYSADQAARQYIEIFDRVAGL